MTPWQIDAIGAVIPKPARLLMRVTRQDFARTQYKRLALLKASTTDVARVSGVRVNARWWREFLAHDPARDYARITAPVLAITGGHDMQVPPEDVAAIGRLVQGSFDGHVPAGLSHLVAGTLEPRGATAVTRSPARAPT